MAKTMQNIWDNLRTRFSNMSSENILDNDELEKSLESGKTVTISNPKSERYTFLPNLTSKKGFAKFKPETREEKDTLSPIGFFRQGEIDSERQKILNEKIASAAKLLGKDLTDEQKELVTLQAQQERMATQDIPSTAIKNVKYDPKTQELWVTFQGSSKKYWYPRVPKEKVEEMMQAPSKGEYFIKNIHDVYTVNPGHKPSNNTYRNSKIARNYYRKMAKAYRKGMKKGTMKGVLNNGRA